MWGKFAKHWPLALYSSGFRVHSKNRWAEANALCCAEASVHVAKLAILPADIGEYGMKTSTVALLAVLAGTATAFAAPQETGPAFAGPFDVFAPLADPANTTISKAFTGLGYTAAGIRVAGTITRQDPDTWAADISVRATAPSGEVYTFPLSADTTAGSGGVVAGLIVSGFAPAAPVTIAGNWTFTIGDTFLDGVAGVVESTIANVLISLEDNAPPASTAVNMTTDGTRTDAFEANAPIKWYLINAPAATGLQFFEIFTGGTVADTEMGLFSITGQRLDVDFEDGDGDQSALSFGGGSGLPLGVADALIGNGADGTLAAGSYYLGVYGSEAAWYPTLWFVDQVLPGTAGDVSLTWRSGTRTVVQPSPFVELGTDPNSTQAVATGPAWFRFISGDVGPFSGRFLDIGTTLGGEDDSEIGLYRDNGSLVISDDDSGVGFLSLLSFGSGAGIGSPTGGTGSSGGLTAGTYWLVAGSWNMTFSNAFGFTGGPGLDFDVVFAAGSTPAPGGTPPATFTDLNTLGNGTVNQSLTFTAGEIKWFRFATPTVASVGSGRFVDLSTELATTNPFTGSGTEIGVFSADGRVVSDDDDGPDFFTALSFGGGAERPAVGTGVPFNGRDGSMPAGTYYAAVAGFQALFAPSFDVTTFSTAVGDVTFKIASNFGPLPCGPSDIASAGPVAGFDGELTSDDIIFFITAFTGGNLAVADIAGPGPSVGADGELTSDDIILFITRFTGFLQSGCP